VKVLRDILRDLVLLGALALCVWLAPKTTLAIEGICGLGTLALYLFERSLFKST
jgi:hypothetical protein